MRWILRGSACDQGKSEYGLVGAVIGRPWDLLNKSQKRFPDVLSGREMEVDRGCQAVGWV